MNYTLFAIIPHAPLAIIFSIPSMRHGLKKPCAIIVCAACDRRFRPFNDTCTTTQKLMSTCPSGGKNFVQ